MTGTLLERPRLPTAFAKSYATRSMPSPRIQTLGRVMEAALGGTSSLGFRSASCTRRAVTKAKSLPRQTVGDGRAIGGRDSDAPSNLRMQRPALRAGADPERAAGKA